ncbi:MAG: hypothetical protein LBP51_00380 [Deferribacteraceae bacterium]|nr:hypothetical protein [Deferribacteraceae bacterium]
MKGRIRVFLKNYWGDAPREDRLYLIFWSVVLVCIIGWLIYLNFSRFLYNVNSDTANEMTFKQMVYSTGSLIPVSFGTANELFLNRLGLFFYLPIYAITKNFNLSQQIMMVFLLFSQSAVIIYLLKQLNFNKAAILFTLSCYLGINPRSTLQFLYFDAYAGFVIVSLLTLAIKINLENRLSKVGGGESPLSSIIKPKFYCLYSLQFICLTARRG